MYCLTIRGGGKSSFLPIFVTPIKKLPAGDASGTDGLCVILWGVPVRGRMVNYKSRFIFGWSKVSLFLASVVCDTADCLLIMRYVAVMYMVGRFIV